MEVPGTRCRLRPSRPAAARMISQGIEATEVVEAIMKGAKRHEGRKVVAALSGKEVVFVKRPCRYFLITVYWLT